MGEQVGARSKKKNRRDSVDIDTGTGKGVLERRAEKADGLIRPVLTQSSREVLLG